jgi:ParB family chromosome partitioning protein
MTTKTKGRPLPAAETTPEIRIEHHGPVALDELRDSPFNPRRRFDQKKLEELADAYRLCPEAIPRPLVRRKGDGLELIFGHRRKRGAKLAGLEVLDVDITEVDDHLARVLQHGENGGREDLHPLDEAEWFAGWTREVGATADVIAAEIGRPVSFVRARLKLAALVGDARAALERGDLGVGQAMLIAGLPAEQQPAVVEEALRETWDGARRTVKQLAKWIEDELSLDLGRAPWELDDATVSISAGACSACPKRTGATADLFAGAIAGDRCLDRACWNEKLAAHIRQKKKSGGLIEVTDAHGSRVKKDGAPLPRGCYAPITATPEDIADIRDQVEFDLKSEMHEADEETDFDAPLPAEKVKEVEERVAKELAERFQECEHARDALVSKGSNKGQVIRVCAEPKCKVHGKGIDAPTVASADDPRPQRDYEAERKEREAKEAIERKVRTAVLKASLEAVKLDRGHLQKAELLELAHADDYALDQIRDDLGWGPKKKLADMPLEELSLRLLAFAFAREAAWGQGNRLPGFAKRHKVDVAKIRKAVLAEAKPKPEKPPAKAEKAKPAAKKKAKAKAKR